MANLIPPEAKKDIIREYWVRVVAVWAVLLGCAMVVVILLSIPTFVLVLSQLNVFSNETSLAMVKQQTFQEAQATIEEANNLSALLVTNVEDISFTQIRHEIDRLAQGRAYISELIFSVEKEEGPSVSITGVASTRSSLAEFSRVIEAHELFGQAVVPISNLAKDKDIPFTITVDIEEATL